LIKKKAIKKKKKKRGREGGVYKGILINIMEYIIYIRKRR
jgi:hypothetical protein